MLPSTSGKEGAAERSSKCWERPRGGVRESSGVCCEAEGLESQAGSAELDGERPGVGQPVHS